MYVHCLQALVQACCSSVVVQHYSAVSLSCTLMYMHELREELQAFLTMPALKICVHPEQRAYLLFCVNQQTHSLCLRTVCTVMNRMRHNYVIVGVMSENCVWYKTTSYVVRITSISFLCLSSRSYVGKLCGTKPHHMW